MGASRSVWSVTAAVLLLCAPQVLARGGSGRRLWSEARNSQAHRERSVLGEVARAALPAVVSITTRQASQPGAPEQERGVGSGIILRADGLILTSAHVVEGAAEVLVSVLTPNGDTEDYVARVVGQDERTDSALLKIRAPRKLPVLKLASAEGVQVGDPVVVIGNPFGLSHSVSAGVVSSLGRTEVTPGGKEGDFDYMQVDASINPGSSGGPVLDMQGHVVAIANAVNIAGQGIGFAIPIDIAKSVLPHLYKHGRVRRGWLGIAVQDCSPDVAAEYNVSPRRGVVISEVREGSPAARAGLRVGDVIVSLDKRVVARAHTLRWQLASRGVGRSVVLEVHRAERPLELRVRLAELPAEARSAPTSQ
jgi:serine protease Do